MSHATKPRRASNHLPPHTDAHPATSTGNRTSLRPKAAGQPAGGQAITFRTSLSLPPRLELESWKEIGQKISRISDSSTWWLGDWLIYGRNRFPERYRRAIAETSLDYQTLRNYAWIARKFPVSRRRSALSFQHHAEVAALPEEEQDLWLAQAEEGNWSRNELRQRLKLAHTETETTPATVDSIKLQISKDQKTRWKTAAAGHECDLEAWIVKVLDSAADPTT